MVDLTTRKTRMLKKKLEMNLETNPSVKHHRGWKDWNIMKIGKKIKVFRRSYMFK